MLPVIQRHKSAPTKAFSLSDSSTLPATREELRKRIQALEQQPDGTNVFKFYNIEQLSVFQNAELFAENLLEDEPDPAPTTPISDGQ
jgi:hypothetical protein